MFKKSISVILASLLLSFWCMPPSVCTAENYSSSNSGEIVINNEIVAPSPRYTNFANVTAGLSITSDGKAKCSGSYITYSNVNTDITVSLMKSTDGETNWTAVSGESWSNSYSTKGNHTSGGTSSSKLSSNYYYCTLTLVRAYDGNGNTTETAYCFSSAYHL